MRFRVIDTFRGLAAVMVILFHMGNIRFLQSTVIVPKGLIFVDFFFVLSGFIIAHTYLGKLHTPADLRRFIWKRFARLYPLHLVTLILFLLWETTRFFIDAHVTRLDAGIFERNDLPAFLANLTLTQSLGLFNSLTWNDPSWSISTEFYTYIIWGCLLVFCKRYLTVATLVLLTGIGWFIYNHNGSLYYTYDYGLIRCLYGFLVGYVTYRLYGRIQTLFDTRRSVSSLIEVVTLSLTITALYAFTEGTSWLMPFLFALLITVFSKEAGVVSGALRHPYFLRLGDLSYSYYLNHYLILTVLYMAVFKFWRLPHTLLIEGAFVLSGLLITHAVSEVTHRYVEFYLTKQAPRRRPLQSTEVVTAIP